MRHHLWLVLAVVLVAGGLTLALTTRTDTSSFGWFAYTPLDEGAGQIGGGTPWGRGVRLVSDWQLLGAGLVVLGLVVAGASLGYRFGRRRAAAP